jgi:hypothetical protein
MLHGIVVIIVDLFHVIAVAKLIIIIMIVTPAGMPIKRPIPTDCQVRQLAVGWFCMCYISWHAHHAAHPNRRPGAAIVI